MTSDFAEKKKDHKKFCAQWSMCLKLGFEQDSTICSRIAQLLRFNTWQPGDEQISMEKHASPHQGRLERFYLITGESIAAVSVSAFLGNLHQKDPEVLYVVDPVDDLDCATAQGI